MIDTSAWPPMIAVMLEQPFADDAGEWWVRVVDGELLAVSRDDIAEVDVLTLSGATVDAVIPEVDGLLAREWFLPRSEAWLLADDAPGGRPFWSRVFFRATLGA